VAKRGQAATNQQRRLSGNLVRERHLQATLEPRNHEHLAL
jgi:hypothetical protein